MERTNIKCPFHLSSNGRGINKIKEQELRMLSAKILFGFLIVKPAFVHHTICTKLETFPKDTDAPARKT